MSAVPLVFSAIVTVVRFVQFLNAVVPIFVTEAGMVMLVKLVHSQNADSTISSTEVPMVTLDRLVQPENAQKPILVILLGMTIVVKSVQY